MKTTLPLMSLVCLLVWSACTQTQQEPAVDTEALKAEIQAMEDAYAAAAVAKDADALVAYYSDDAVSYGANEPPQQGKAAIREDRAAMMARDTVGLTPTFRILDLYAGGDYVTEIGSYSVANPAGETVDEGTYMSLFKKGADGKWMCIRDMAVSSRPKEKPAGEEAPAAE